MGASSNKAISEIANIKENINKQEVSGSQINLSLNPQQKQLVNQFQNKSGNDQAQAIADYCNKNGIGKEKLQEIINMLNKK